MDQGAVSHERAQRVPQGLHAQVMNSQVGEPGRVEEAFRLVGPGWERLAVAMNRVLGDGGKQRVQGVWEGSGASASTAAQACG